MKRMLTACERCGLREVRHELERRGVIIRFCDECYWGEAEENDTASSAGERPSEPAATPK